MRAERRRHSERGHPITSKRNKDAKTIADDKAASPAMSVLAVTLGSLLIVPPFVSYWKTWSRGAGGDER